MVRNLTCQRVNGLPIYFSLSLSSHLLFSSSNIESTTSSLVILISIFIIQSWSLHFSGDFDFHLPHPISITPSSLSGLKRRICFVLVTQLECGRDKSVFFSFYDSWRNHCREFRQYQRCHSLWSFRYADFDWMIVSQHL